MSRRRYGRGRGPALGLPAMVAAIVLVVRWHLVDFLLTR